MMWLFCVYHRLWSVDWSYWRLRTSCHTHRLSFVNDELLAGLSNFYFDFFNW